MRMITWVLRYDRNTISDRAEARVRGDVRRAGEARRMVLRGSVWNLETNGWRVYGHDVSEDHATGV